MRLPVFRLQANLKAKLSLIVAVGCAVLGLQTGFAEVAQAAIGDPGVLYKTVLGPTRLAAIPGFVGVKDARSTNDGVIIVSSDSEVFVSNLSNPVPGKVPGLSNVKTAISDFANGFVALKNDGTVWAWGSNTFGWFGNSDTAAVSTVPVQVPGISELLRGNETTLMLMLLVRVVG